MHAHGSSWARVFIFYFVLHFPCISIACEGMLVIRRHVNSVHDLQGGCGTANGVSWQPACRLPCRRRGLRHSASFYSFQTSWGVFPLLDWTQVLSTGVTGLGRCVCRMLGLHNLQVVVFCSGLLHSPSSGLNVRHRLDEKMPETLGRISVLRFCS